jgi:hypothetical protein
MMPCGEPTRSDAPAEVLFTKCLEGTFSKVKGLLRKAKARSFEALVEATGRSLSEVTKEDARGFFGQLLGRLRLHVSIGQAF